MEQNNSQVPLSGQKTGSGQPSGDARVPPSDQSVNNVQKPVARSQGSVQSQTPSIPAGPQGNIPASPPSATSPVVSPPSVPPPEHKPNFIFSSESEKRFRLPFSLKWLFIPLLILAVAGVGAFFARQYFHKQKQELVSATKKQVETIASLEETYGKVVRMIKDLPDENSPEAERLLGVSDSTLTEEQKVNEISNVLGVEDDPGIAIIRQLTEFYRQAKSVAKEVGDHNESVRNKYQAFPAGLIFPDPGELFKDTDYFVESTSSLMDYLDQSNQLEIELYSWSYETGLLINEVILRPQSQVSIDTLEEKINEFGGIKNKAQGLETSFLSADLRQSHEKMIDDLILVERIYNQILTSLKTGDAQGLLNAFEEFLLKAMVESETVTLDTINFWQNDLTVQSVKTIKKDWQDFQSKLEG